MAISTTRLPIWLLRAVGIFWGAPSVFLRQTVSVNKRPSDCQAPFCSEVNRVGKLRKFLTPAEVVVCSEVNRAGKLRQFLTPAEVVVHIEVNRAGDLRKFLMPAEVV